MWYISPIKKPFPKLTGPYHVGTVTVSFIDQERQEHFSQSIHDKRAVIGHIFFPTDNVMHLKKAFYMGNKMSAFQKGYSEYYGFPEWFTNLLFRNITIQAYEHALLFQDQKQYPVVLFSHGLLGTPSDMYVVLLEDLASHGYIVIGLDHPYFNWITMLSDGTIVSSHALAQQFEKMNPYQQKEFQSNAINMYKADMKFLINQLAHMNQDVESQFYHRLDLEHIGVMGHSAGGTAAIEFCREDSRCKAAVDLDGWYDQVIGYQPIKQPLLLLFGSKSIEVGEPTPEYLQRKQLTREQYFECEKKIVQHKQELCGVPQCSMIVLKGLSHGDFGDGLLSKWPLRAWNDVDSYKTITQINRYILQFFDTYLK